MKSPFNSRFHVFILLLFLGLTGCNPSDNNDDPENQTKWQILSDSPLFNGSINSIASDASGNIFVSGGSNNNNNEYFVAKWQKNTATWSELGPGSSQFNGGIHPPVVTDAWGNIYAVGRKSVAGRNDEIYLVKWSEPAGKWIEFGGTNQPSFNNGIFSMVTDHDGNLYVAGDFFDITNHRFVAKWEKNSGQWQKLGHSFTNLSICLFADQSGSLYASGSDDASHEGACISKWDPFQGWKIVGGFESGLGGEILSITVDDSGNVYAAGHFFADGQFYNIAKWDKSNWSYMKIMNGEQKANAILADASGNIYAAGDFTNDKGETFVAKWDGNEWTDLGNLHANHPILALCLDAEGNIYAGGEFTGGRYSHYVAFMKL